MKRAPRMSGKSVEGEALSLSHPGIDRSEAGEGHGGQALALGVLGDDWSPAPWGDGTSVPGQLAQNHYFILVSS